jgi:hypothetical protein
VQGQVAVAAQRDQVLLRTIPGWTPKLLVMNLEVLQAPAGLTSPSIALQDFSTKLLVQFGIQAQALLLRSNLTHDAFRRACARNACRCSLGRNLKNLVIENSISGLGGPGWFRPGSPHRSFPKCGLGIGHPSTSSQPDGTQHSAVRGLDREQCAYDGSSRGRQSAKQPPKGTQRELVLA